MRDQGEVNSNSSASGRQNREDKTFGRNHDEAAGMIYYKFKDICPAYPVPATCMQDTTLKRGWAKPSGWRSRGRSNLL